MQQTNSQSSNNQYLPNSIQSSKNPIEFQFCTDYKYCKVICSSEPLCGGSLTGMQGKVLQVFWCLFWYWSLQAWRTSTKSIYFCIAKMLTTVCYPQCQQSPSLGICSTTFKNGESNGSSPSLPPSLPYSYSLLDIQCYAKHRKDIRITEHTVYKWMDG